ncbi:MAG: thermonuclease family protein [Candidatus Competibacteraceae bacterium]|nr:thermonuclease family protein [Candidatus Competibacteraceae bacterium]
MDIQTCQHIRLSGINTPELHTEEGKQAKIILVNTVFLKKVTLEIDPNQSHDKYGRLLAVIWLEGVNINQSLIDDGYAVAYDGGKRPTSPTTHPTATLPLPEIKPA